MVSRNAEVADDWSLLSFTFSGPDIVTNKENLWLTWKVFYFTCHVKNRFESQTKATDFHGILYFDAVTDQTDASPIFFGKFGVVVGIKCWTL